MIAYIEPMPSAETSETGESRASEAGAADTGTDTTQPARARTAASSERGEAGSVEQEPGDRLPVAGEKVDTILAGSGLSLGKPGEQLGVINEEAPPVFEHLDDWTVAPPGEDLVENDENRSLLPRIFPIFHWRMNPRREEADRIRTRRDTNEQESKRTGLSRTVRSHGLGRKA